MRVLCQNCAILWKVPVAVDNLVNIVWVCPVLPSTSTNAKICDKYGPQCSKECFMEFVWVWGNVCPARARRATFLLTIPTSAPDLPSHGEGPPNRP